MLVPAVMLVPHDYNHAGPPNAGETHTRAHLEVVPVYAMIPIKSVGRARNVLFVIASNIYPWHLYLVVKQCQIY